MTEVILVLGCLHTELKSRKQWLCQGDPNGRYKGVLKFSSLLTDSY